MSSADKATQAARRRWARYLVEERAEAQVYERLASRRNGPERDILLQLAAAEHRHEQHWLSLLGGEPEKLPRAGFSSRVLGWMAGRFGMVFVLALAQNAEARSPYDEDSDATAAMRADEKVHHEVVRELAAQGRLHLSGSFRAAVFGASDGLVSNLALVMAIGATGVAPSFVLFSGIAGLLAGALSMGVGEYISVGSQREMIAATEPSESADNAAVDLDIDANELALVYRARGLDDESSLAKARQVVAAAKAGASSGVEKTAASESNEAAVVGSAWRAASSSFLFFASGALIPVLPWLFGLSGMTAIAVALLLVGLALLGTGALVGILAGGPPLKRALRQLAFGFGAAAITYTLGLLFAVGAP